MTLIDVRIDPQVFNQVYLQYLNNTARTQIFYGGSGSGKSVFLAQRCVYDILSGGRNYLVCRQVGRTVRGSVAQEIGKIISGWGLSSLFTINKTDGTITCENGYQVVFAGLDDVEKLKSTTPAKGVITDIWVEEATEADEPTVKQLMKRQRGGDESIKKRFIMSFNPILQLHWIYQRYFTGIGWADDQKIYQDDDLLILKTTYKDNRFLTDADRRDLENETDKYFYEVYTLGNWGILGNAIFTNWRVEDLSGMRAQFTSRHAGLDFGFSQDPAALSVSHYDARRKIIYFFDEFYEAGLTNDLLAKEIREKIGTGRVVCDSSEPKSIAELKRYGVNAVPAVKGKDSVLHGIQWLQQHTLVLDKSIINGANELRMYKWKEDRAGNVLAEPVDRFNHWIDATRYAYEDESRGGRKMAMQHEG